MKPIKLVSSLAVIGVVAGIAAPSSAATHIPVFESEAVPIFDRALQASPHHRQTLSASRDHTGYRAYRFLNPDMVLVGMASAVYIDAAGRVHVVQAHGEPMEGHLNKSHEEYSHILVPPSVVLPHR